MLPTFSHAFSTPLAIGMPNGFEWLIIAAIGLLVFGKRLPEVGRGLGKGIVEFKKGLKGVEDEVTQVDQEVDRQAATQKQEPPRIAQQTTVQQFDPYTGKPIAAASTPADHAAHS